MMNSLRVTIAVLCAAVCTFAQAPAIPYVTPDTPFGTGAYKAMMEVDAGLPTHTVYHPKDLAALKGKKLPVIVWGNGACANAGNRFRQFLTEIASHGFLAVAIGPIGPKEMEAAPQPAPPPQPGVTPSPPNRGAPATMSSQLIDAINWAMAENTRKGSPYYGKLDAKKIAIMGQSCGGVQAIKASLDPRVTMTIAWNSGLIPRQSPAMEWVEKDHLNKLHAPIAWFNGDPGDVAHNNAKDDFERTTQVPALFAWREGMGHSGTYREANGGELGKIAVAYLNWRLRGDKQAAKMFVGADCGLCRDKSWHVFKKKID
ncbi:MAG: alpha/beta hydrolase [Blastocatellia bacterium]